MTLVADKDKTLSLEAVGYADLAAKKPMQVDNLFWIASMTKPITATAVLMLQDEGKLSVDDPVAKYLPELANLKTPSGKPAGLTLRHLLTHTSGMAEATPQESRAARTLADLIPHFAEKPLQFEPGTRWQYCQSGINSLGRIVEVVSGQSLPEFLQKRLFDPLGMKDTTFYPTQEQIGRLAKSYKAQRQHAGRGYDFHTRQPQPHVPRPLPGGQRRVVFHGPGLRPLLPDAAQPGLAGWQAVPQVRNGQADDHDPDRRVDDRFHGRATAGGWEFA